MFLAYRLARVAWDKGPLNGRCIFVLYGLFTWSYISCVDQAKPYFYSRRFVVADAKLGGVVLCGKVASDLRRLRRCIT